MPLQKGSSISLPADQQQKQYHLKRKQQTFFEENTGLKKDDEIGLSKDLSKNRLIRSNDILIQSSFETLMDMLKAYAGIKECSEETQVHLNMVILKLFFFNSNFLAIQTFIKLDLGPYFFNPTILDFIRNLFKN